MRKFKVGDFVCFKSDRRFKGVVEAMRGGGRVKVLVAYPTADGVQFKSLVRNSSLFAFDNENQTQ